MIEMKLVEELLKGILLFSRKNENLLEILFVDLNLS